MQTIPVDYSKLKSEFIGRGITAYDAAMKLGLSRNYFYAMGPKGMISLMVANALKCKYNIAPEDYAPDSPFNACVEYVKSAAPKDSAEANVLYDIMFKAAYDAMKKVLDE
jgi:hypothetical protein